MGGTGGAPIEGPQPGKTEPSAPEPMAVADRPLRLADGCSTEGPARFLFEIPRAGESSGDFYRLPFPSDVRRRDGKVDFAEMPRAGVALVGFDLVDRYLGAVGDAGLGFGLNPTVFFRVTQPLGAIPGGSALPPGESVQFIDVTPGAPELGARIPHRMHVPSRGRYFCGTGVAVEPLPAAPLLPGHTYAVVIFGPLAGATGEKLVADVDLRAVLGPVAPGGTERRQAWEDHAPLRAFLSSAAATIPAGDVLAAAVFTTEAGELPAALRAAVQSGPAPQVTELIRCGEGRTSSCDDGRAPACATVPADPDLVEYRGRLRIPNFQKGLAPYEKEGAIAVDAAGQPQVVRQEEICFVLTTPRAPAPGTGFPLVIYSHGTGGHFRSPVESGLAGEYARGEVDGGAAVPMAFLGYEGVLHGSRKGVSARSTEELVYNFLNPEAARGNSLQAAVDLFALARGLSALSALSAKAGAALDLKRVGLYGHSQGGNAAAVAAGFEPSFGVVALSGTGGGLAGSLLEKSKPLPVAPLIATLLGETTPVTASHPILSILQMYFDAGDPLNYARRIVMAPASGMVPRHLLHVFGARDSYAPESTQRKFGQAGLLPVLHPVGVAGADGKSSVLTGEVRANVSGQVTAVQAQYTPDGYDGHFVSTHHPRARRAIQRMLGTTFRDGIPSVD